MQGIVGLVIRHIHIDYNGWVDGLGVRESEKGTTVLCSV